MGETIEDFAAEPRLGPLIFQQMILQDAAETVFQPIHGGFRQTATMITDFLLPALAADATNRADRFVARKRIVAAIAMLFDLRVALRRNDRRDALLGQRGVDLPLVVAAVAVELVDRLLDVLQYLRNRIGVMAAVFRENFRHDLVRRGVHRQVQFSPRPTLGHAVLTRFPLAFAKHFQARAVDDDVDRPAAAGDRERYVERGGPFRQRRVVANRHVDLHQHDQRAAQAFGLPIWKPKQFTQHEQAFDRRIAVYKRASNLGLIVRMFPRVDHLIAKPERDRAALHERLVILSPLRNLVPCLCLGNNFSLLQGEKRIRLSPL